MLHYSWIGKQTKWNAAIYVLIYSGRRPVQEQEDTLGIGKSHCLVG